MRESKDGKLMQKLTLVMITLLAAAVSAVCSLRQKTPQLPTAIRRDVRLIQTTAAATPSEARASKFRTTVAPEDVSEAIAAV